MGKSFSSCYGSGERLTTMLPPEIRENGQKHPFLPGWMELIRIEAAFVSEKVKQPKIPGKQTLSFIEAAFVSSKVKHPFFTGKYQETKSEMVFTGKRVNEGSGERAKGFGFLSLLSLFLFREGFHEVAKGIVEGQRKEQSIRLRSSIRRIRSLCLVSCLSLKHFLEL